jgi:hypothetical protein
MKRWKGMKGGRGEGRGGRKGKEKERGRRKGRVGCTPEMLLARQDVITRPSRLERLNRLMPTA